MRDEHLTPVLTACSEAELALLIEFLGRPPSGLLWLDPRIRSIRSTPGHSQVGAAHAAHAERVAAVVEEIIRCGNHSVTGRIGGGSPSYVQIVCDALHELELTEAPAPGVLELEMRVVRFVLDTEFDRLAPDLQEQLLAGFFAGEFFVGGLRGYAAIDPFLTRVDADRRVLGAGKLARAMRKVGAQQLRKRVTSYATRTALRVVLRSFAGPVHWALTAWDWLGPAYRLTVPVICYVAFLRHAQVARADATGSVDAPEAQALAAS